MLRTLKWILLAAVFLAAVYSALDAYPPMDEWKDLQSVTLWPGTLYVESLLVVGDSAKIGEYWFPYGDGTNGQVLKTNASGKLSWSDDLQGGAGTDSSWVACSVSVVYPFVGHDTIKVGNVGDTVRFRAWSEFYQDSIIVGVWGADFSKTVWAAIKDTCDSVLYADSAGYADETAWDTLAAYWDTLTLKDTLGAYWDSTDADARYVNAGEENSITYSMINANNSEQDSFFLGYHGDVPYAFEWYPYPGRDDSTWKEIATSRMRPYRTLGELTYEDTFQVGIAGDTARFRGIAEFYNTINTGTWGANLSGGLWSEIVQDSAAKQAADTATVLRGEMPDTASAIAGDTANVLRAEMPDSAKAHCVDEGQAESITEPMLDCQNAPTDEWALTWESDGGGEFQWKDLTPAGQDSEYVQVSTDALLPYTGRDTIRVGIDGVDTVRVRAVMEFFQDIETGTWAADLSAALWTAISDTIGDTATALRTELKGAIGDTANDLRAEMIDSAEVVAGDTALVLRAAMIDSAEVVTGDTALVLRAAMKDSAKVVCGDSMQVVWDSLAHYPDTVAFYDSLDNQVAKGEANSITEPMLDADNSPTDEWALTWETDGGGKFSWANITGGAADSEYVTVQTKHLLPYSGEDTIAVGASGDTARVRARVEHYDSTIVVNARASGDFLSGDDVVVGDDIHISDDINLTETGILFFDGASGQQYILSQDNDLHINAVGLGSHMRFATSGIYCFLNSEGTPDTLLQIRQDSTITFAEAYTFPNEDGDDGQVLKTYSGVLGWYDDLQGGGSDSSFVTCSTAVLGPYPDEDTIQIGITGDTARVRGQMEFHTTPVLKSNTSFTLEGPNLFLLKDNDNEAAAFHEPVGVSSYLSFKTTDSDERVTVNEPLWIGTEYVFPSADGSDGDVLQTNGSGTVSWQDPGEASDTSFVTCSTSVVGPYPGEDTVTLAALNDTVRLRGLIETHNNIRMLNTAGDPTILLQDERANSLIFSEAGNAYLTFMTTNLAEKVIFNKPLNIYNAYTFPVGDGSAGQQLRTNGSGSVAWQNGDSTFLACSTAAWKPYIGQDTMQVGVTDDTVRVRAIAEFYAPTMLYNAADPTLDRQGEFGLDETDDALIIHDGTSEKVYAHHTYYFTATVNDDGNWTDDAQPIWQAPKDYAITITEVRATVMGSSTPTLTYNIEERAYGSLGSAGTNIYSSDQVADDTGEIETSFSNAGIAANAHLVLCPSAEGGTTDLVTIRVSYTKDVE